MKIIFLDIDGVLAVCHKERDEYGSLFHSDFVDNLQRIISETGAKIVISSTWRSSGLQVMKEMWKHRNLPGEVIDITPYFYSKDYGKLPRGLEINRWLELKQFTRINYSKEVQKTYLESSVVKNYVILDDDSDMLYNQREHFVQCSGFYARHSTAIEGYGLTAERAVRAIGILNSSIIDLYYR